MVKQKILLLGVTTLTRLFASVWDRRQLDYGEFWLNCRAHCNAAGCSRCSSPLRAATAILFWTNCVAHQPELARLECWTLSEFRELRLEDLDLARVPPGRLRALARYAALSRAQAGASQWEIPIDQLDLKVHFLSGAHELIKNSALNTGKDTVQAVRLLCQCAA
jgi:hypothetical protein